MHSLILFAITLAAAAQTVVPPPVDLPRNLRPKLISPIEAIHVTEDPSIADDPKLPSAERLAHLRDPRHVRNQFVTIELEVIVNENGRVESAHAIAGPDLFRAQAEAIELRRAFQPIVLKGQIVRARLNDYVSVYPPEEWSQFHTSFPTSFDPAAVTITLQRSHCYGSCPAYTVTLTGTGDVTFNSDDTSLAAIGHHTAHIAPTAVTSLLDQFRAADFLSARDNYTCGWTDNPTQVLTLTINGQGISKHVTDYCGQLVGMPTAIANLETAIDTTVHIDRWTVGNSETLPSLQAENWNFSSTAPDNLLLYDSSIQRKDKALVQTFLAHRVPIFTELPSVRSPVCVASQTGDRELVRQMLSTLPAHSMPKPADLSECLNAAARSSNLSLVDLWLDKGARPITPDRPAPGTPYNFAKFDLPIAAAIDSHNPDILARILALHPQLQTGFDREESPILYAIQRGDLPDKTILPRIVTLLLNAGADFDRNSSRNPLYFTSSAPEVIPILIQAGADPNGHAYNGDPDTPLMWVASSPEAVKQLLAAGADPTRTNRQKQTALNIARQFKCQECVTLLESGTAHWKTTHPMAP
jgi:ankyrin repeat protein